jgi:hypothetical protein
MKKNLGQSRLLFNEETLDINLIIDNIENEQWVTINYQNDLWRHFIKQFPKNELIKTLKKTNKRLTSIKVIMRYSNLRLSEAVQFIDKM